MPSLRELEAVFVVRTEVSYRRVASLIEAHGLLFLCPACFAKNNGPVGTHVVLCWFRDRGVPDSASPGPGRWSPTGTGIDDLSFVGSGCSVDLRGGSGCQWHGFVINGSAQ
jgi:hypothetical protein